MFNYREYEKARTFIDSLKPLHYALLHSKYAVTASTKQCSLQVYFLCSTVYRVDRKALTTDGAYCSVQKALKKVSTSLAKQVRCS